MGHGLDDLRPPGPVQEGPNWGRQIRGRSLNLPRADFTRPQVVPIVLIVLFYVLRLVLDEYQLEQKVRGFRPKTARS
jgi:hypothetical protein